MQSRTIFSHFSSASSRAASRVDCRRQIDPIEICPQLARLHRSCASELLALVPQAQS